MKKNVLITGGTGFVGRNLTEMLLANGYTVSILSRSKKNNSENVFYYTWDIDKQLIQVEAIQNADYIIHLAGENIAQERWTKKRKEAIQSSRSLSAQLLYSCLQKTGTTVEAFISASAVGIYGAVNGQATCTENMKPANDFLGITCQKWEAAAVPFEKLGIRTVKIRTALVLGKDEGLLKRLGTVFKLKLGSALGSGKQYMPWIYIEDLCRVYLEALQNAEMKGAYNASIEDDTTNTTFSKTLAKVYGYSIWLPNVPAFLLKLALGEMSKIILTGRKISNDKIQATGFEFKHQNLENTLKKCLSK